MRRLLFTKIHTILPSFVRNSEDVRIVMSKVQLYDASISEIRNSDAIDMYPNIDTHKGLHCATDYMIEKEHEIRVKISINIITDILTLMIKKIIFKFGST